MPHYTGPCSDCGVEVSTHSDDAGGATPGGAFSSERAAHPKHGAVYLLCGRDIARREVSPQWISDDWRPGPKHDAAKVVPHAQ